MSDKAYSAEKALWFPDRIEALRRGEQPYPVHVQLILSDFCSHSCNFCAYRMEGYTSNQLFKDEEGSNNPKRMIPQGKAKEIIDDCVAMGVKALQFTGGGEPTVHPAIKDVMAYAQMRGIKTAIVTHGGHIEQRDLWDEIINSEWIRISVDAGTKETYGSMRRTAESNFSKVWDAIRELSYRKSNSQSKVTIGVGFVVSKENWKEVVDATRMAKQVGADNIRISGVFSTDGPRYFDGFLEEARDLVRYAKELENERFKVYERFTEKVSDLEQGSPEDSFCGYQHMTTYIGGDLSVYRCCVMSYNQRGYLGSLKEQGFKQMWDSQEKKDRMNDFDARGCSLCQFLDKNKSIGSAIAPVEHKEFV